MDLLKTLAMPLQLPSLLFVLCASLLLTVVTHLGTGGLVLALFVGWLILTALTRYAFVLIDDAANGVRETATVSAEMFNPVDDARCWMHPLLTAAIGATLAVRPELPRLPVLLGYALLLPLSLAATALSGRALDALNPAAMARVLRGLGHWYLFALLWLALCAAVAAAVMHAPIWTWLQIATLQLLVLLLHAGVGAALFQRRLDLDFVPRLSPERVIAQQQDAREARRQQMIDGLYRDLRVREPDRAIGNARQWLAQTGPLQLPGDVRAILEAGASWTERHDFALLLRALVPQLLAMKQPALAFLAAESALVAAPGFAPEQETDAVEMIRFALLTGRKRLAATLLANYLARSGGKESASAALRALQARLQDLPGTR